MSKYLVRRGIRGMFKVNQDEIDITDYINTGIDWIYKVDDDGTVTCKDKDGDYTIDVKKGDLVIQFYYHEGRKHPIIAIHNDEWNENIEGVEQVDLSRIKKCDACTDSPCDYTREPA